MGNPQVVFLSLNTFDMERLQRLVRRGVSMKIRYPRNIKVQSIPL